MRTLQLLRKHTSSRFRTPGSRLLVKLSAGMIALVSSLALGGATPASGTTPSSVGPVQVIPGVSGFAAVSCNTGNLCVAVGTGAEGGEVLPISDGTPGTVSVVTGSDQDLSDLSLVSVDCTGPAECVAVGSAWAPSGLPGLEQIVGVIVPINDGIPEGEVTVAGQGTVGTPDFVTLSAVSCYQSTCVAAGSDDYLGPIIVPLSTATETPVPIEFADFNGLSCHANGACVAVGYFDNSYSGMLLVDEDAPGNSKGIPASNDVACRSSYTCIAVGGEPFFSSTVGDVVTIRKHAPGTGEVVPGTNTLNSVACAGPKYCVAAGSNSSDEGVLVTIAGSRIHGAVIVEGSEGWSSVACSNVGFCIVIGNAEGQTVFTTFGLPTG